MDLRKAVTVTPLRIIPVFGGDVLHALKSSEDEFSGFGEAYFSFIENRMIKGWKKHTSMTLNIFVPHGSIKFVIFDDRPKSNTKGDFFAVILSKKNYQRLTIDPGLWVAFQGVEHGVNILLNIANIQHDPEESINRELDQIYYDW